MATGALDANGIWRYGEDDPLSPYSGFMDLLADSVSDQIALLRAATQDSGWITTGWTMNVTGGGTWTPVSVGGWRSLAYRRTGKRLTLNGTVQKVGAAYAANETILTMPTALWPSARSNQSGRNSNTYISSDGTVKITDAGAASTPFGVDLTWLVD